jgi:hypothetical protein
MFKQVFEEEGAATQVCFIQPVSDSHGVVRYVP